MVTYDEPSNTYGLEMIRSDTGDGGWSLHAPWAEGPDGLAPILLSGPAEWDEEAGEWNRPTQADYDAAAEHAPLPPGFVPDEA